MFCSSSKFVSTTRTCISMEHFVLNFVGHNALLIFKYRFYFISDLPSLIMFSNICTFLITVICCIYNLLIFNFTLWLIFILLNYAFKERVLTNVSYFANSVKLKEEHMWIWEVKGYKQIILHFSIEFLFAWFSLVSTYWVTFLCKAL